MHPDDIDSYEPATDREIRREVMNVSRMRVVKSFQEWINRHNVGGY